MLHRSRLLTLLFAICLLLTSRTARAEDPPLAGTWEHADGPNTITVILNADGTGKMDAEAVRWSATGNTLSMTVAGEVIKYTVKLEGDSLTVSGGDLDKPTLFKRKAAPVIKRGLGARLGAGGNAGAAKEPANELQAFAGKWEIKANNGTIPLELKPDGSGSINNNEMKWTVKDGVMNTEVAGRKLTYKVAVNGDKLSMTNTDNNQTVTWDRAAVADKGEGPFGALNKLGGNDARPATLIGKWEATDGTQVEFTDDGKFFFGGRAFPYTATKERLSFTGPAGKVEWNYTVERDRLTMVIEGVPQTLTRVGAGGGAAAVKKDDAAQANAGGGDLLGTWRDEVGAELQIGRDAMVFMGTNIPYTKGDGTLNVSVQGNAMRWPYKLNGDTLQITIGEQTSTLKRIGGGGGGGAAKKNDERGDASNAPKGNGSLVGNWEGPEGLMMIREDGTVRGGGKTGKWSADGTTLSLSDDTNWVKVPYKLDGDKLVLGSGPSVTFTRTSGAAGVYVGSEATLDPANFMSITHYLTLYPDGSVGFFKSEAGATRQMITENLERFRSWKNPGQDKGKTYGKWEAQGDNIVIQWQGAFGNRAMRAQLNPATMKLTVRGLGILEEGATVTLDRQ